jgi:hypothetical protein
LLLPLLLKLLPPLLALLLSLLLFVLSLGVRVLGTSPAGKRPAAWSISLPRGARKR